MEIFRYRNLALASFCFLVVLFISYYFNNAVRIAALTLTGVAFLLLVLICTLSHQKLGLGLLIRLTPSLILICLASVLSLVHFDNSEIEGFCDNKPHEVTAIVHSVTYTSDYFSSSEIEILEIDGKELETDISMISYSPAISERSLIRANGYFLALDDSASTYDLSAYMLSKGITVQFQVDSYEIVDTVDADLNDLLKDASKTLDNRLLSINDDITHGMLSALFLGNKNNLPDEARRDFSRIGLSHVLALSGMHIAIIVTLLGYALCKLPVSRIIKEIILILSILLFIGITGFSESAMRAGIMVFLTYTLFFFGTRLSLTSSLFYSVTIICVFNPYSIFSMSLQLSFLAMLGCIFSSKIIHRAHRLKCLKPKFIRYITYTALTSITICLFTLPVVSVSIGRISLLSPLTNILLGPLFSVLVFLTPIYLLVANIPFISNIFAFSCKSITHAIVSVGSIMANHDNIIIPIMNTIQFTGIIISSVFIFGMLIFRKRVYTYIKLGVALGVAVFVGGAIFLFCQREVNVYASVHSFANNDIICVEDSGDITVIDISCTSASYSSTATLNLGYYEIDNYIICDYSSNSDFCFDDISSNTIIRQVYLRAPEDDKETELYNSIHSIAKGKGIKVLPLKDSVHMKNSTIRFASTSNVPTSTKRAIALTVECEGSAFTYLGASTFELYDKFIENSAYLSDIIVFGSYGPTYKTEYSYDTPYLDHVVFLSNSRDYAAKEFLENIKSLQCEARRFRLTP